MVDTEAHLDKVFTEHAEAISENMCDKLYRYTRRSADLLDNSVIGRGICRVLSCTYSRELDCDIFTCKDIVTGKAFRANQFCIEFEERTTGSTLDV